jgi:excisionase family DNA binding protein
MGNLDRKSPNEGPLAHTVEGAARVTTCGRTSVYAAIKAGELKARKIGRRTIILDEDLRAWLANLPEREAV